MLLVGHVQHMGRAALKVDVGDGVVVLHGCRHPLFAHLHRYGDLVIAVALPQPFFQHLPIGVRRRRGHVGVVLPALKENEKQTAYWRSAFL